MTVPYTSSAAPQTSVPELPQTQTATAEVTTNMVSQVEISTGTQGTSPSPGQVTLLPQP